MADHNTNGASPQSIKITKRSDRSIRMLVLQKFLFMLKTYLARAKTHHPPESVRLKPPSSVHQKCTVKERQVDGIWIYDLELKRSSLMPRVDTAEHSSNGKFSDTQRKRRIYYFAGGGWQMPPSGTHWKTLAEIVHRLSLSSPKSQTPIVPTVISLISFPLAPAAPAPVTFPKLAQLYETLVGASHSANEYIIFGGDSAGGNLACALVLYAVSQTRPSPADAPMPTAADTAGETHSATAPPNPDPSTNSALAPHAVLALCPSVHLCRDTECPSLKAVEKKDPLLSIAFITSTADYWVGKKRGKGRRLRAKAFAEKAGEQRPPSELPEPWEKTDPRVSPLRADIGALARAGVRVHGTTGGYDLLSGDARKFRDRCNEEGVAGKWLEWDRQMHCWHLSWTVGLPEAKEALDWIVEVLREEGA